MRAAELVTDRTIGRARDASLPVVIAGDFNCDSDNVAFSPFRSAGMLDARAEATDGVLGPPETCPGSAFVAGTRPGVRIDYILVSPNLSVRRFATMTDHMYGVHPSDHFPIWAELEI
jgi:endonuclease/exonuclease/phosphatase family metal-dependent hydrolase